MVANKKSIGDCIEGLSKDIGLPVTFFRDLRSADDWSFIIQLHALFEAAVMHLLNAHYGDGFEKIFDRMNMNGRMGKLSFAKAAKLIGHDDAEFIEVLSRIRNDFVHDITNVNANLQKYIDVMNPDRRRQFTEAFAVTIGDAPIKDDHKLSIYLRSAICLAELYSEQERAYELKALEQISLEGFKLDEPTQS